MHGFILPCPETLERMNCRKRASSSVNNLNANIKYCSFRLSITVNIVQPYYSFLQFGLRDRIQDAYFPITVSLLVVISNYWIISFKLRGNSASLMTNSSSSCVLHVDEVMATTITAANNDELVEILQKFMYLHGVQLRWPCKLTWAFGDLHVNFGLNCFSPLRLFSSARPFCCSKPSPTSKSDGKTT